jgi:unsaturated chondroitin disaccharide hydrolase
MKEKNLDMLIKKVANEARKYSKSTIMNFIRDNASTINAIDFDLDTGSIIKKRTLLGYSINSCWSRGQAWAIYGFTLAYKTSRDEILLETAKKF